MPIAKSRWWYGIGQVAVIFLPLLLLVACQHEITAVSKLRTPFPQQHVWQLNIGSVQINQSLYPGLPAKVQQLADNETDIIAEWGILPQQTIDSSVADSNNVNDDALQLAQLSMQKQLSERVQNYLSSRFIAIGLEGELQIRMLQAAAYVITTAQAQTTYVLMAALHLRLEQQQIYHERIIPLQTTVKITDAITLQQQQRIAQAMLADIIYQLQQATGANLQTELLPLHYDPGQR